jgi:tetratricopeptide (TPR) repeat protein
MNNLASSYYDADRDQEAIMLFGETLQLYKANLGPEHSDTLRTMNNLANCYLGVGEEAKAMAILNETLILRERRLKTEPSNSTEQANLGWTHGQMGAAKQACLDYAAAVQAYARSVEMFERLDQAGALIDPFFRAKFNTFRQGLALCRKAERAVKDLDFVLQQPAVEVPGLLDMRVRFLLKDQKLYAAVESAAKMKERTGDKAEQLYNAACAYALCAGAAKNASPPAHLPQGARGDKLADEALALLEKAVAKGWKNTEHMKKDDDLKSLREREDFRRLLGELEKQSQNGKHIVPNTK